MPSGQAEYPMRGAVAVVGVEENLQVSSVNGVHLDLDGRVHVARALNQ